MTQNRQTGQPGDDSFESDPMASPAGEAPGPFSRPAKRIRRRRHPLLRWIGMAIGVGAALLVLAVIYLQLFFPTETVKNLLIQEIKKNYSQKVEIGSFRFSLLRGVTASDLNVSGLESAGNGRLLKLGSVRLSYDPWKLLFGRLVFSQIRFSDLQLFLTQNEGRWNFEPFLPQTGPGAETGKTGGAGSPLPLLALDLKELDLDNLILQVVEDNNVRFVISHLDLKISGSAGMMGSRFTLDLSSNPSPNQFGPNVLFEQETPEAINASMTLNPDMALILSDFRRLTFQGSVKISKPFFSYGEEFNLSDVTANLKGDLDLDSQVGSLEELLVKVGQRTEIGVQGKASNVMESPKVDLAVLKSRLDTADFGPLLEKLLPGITVAGNLEIPEFHVQGEPLAEDPALKADGNFQVHLGRFDYPQEATSISAMEGSVTLHSAGFSHLRLESVDGSGEFRSPSVTLSGVPVLGLDLRLRAKSLPNSPNRIRMETDLTANDVSFPSVQSTQIQQAAASLNWEGDPVLGDLDISPSKIRLGDYFSCDFSGSLRSFGRQGFQIKSEVQSDLFSLWSKIPPPLKSSLKTVSQVSGKVSTQSRIAGQLTEAFLPSSAEIDVEGDFSKISLLLSDPNVTLNGLDQHVVLKGHLSGPDLVPDADFRGETTVRFDSISLLDGYNLGQTRLDLKWFDFAHHPEPVEGLDPAEAGKNRLGFQGEFEGNDFRMSQGEMRINQKQFGGNLKGTTDRLGEKIELSQMNVNLPGLLSGNASGSFNQKDDSFQIAARLEKVNLQRLAQMGATVSESLQKDFLLNGVAQIKLNSDGKIPTPRDWEKMSLPIRLSTELRVSDGEVDSPANSFKAKGLSALFQVNLENQDLSLEGNLKSSDFRFTEGTRKEPFSPEFRFSYSLKNWDQLEIQNQELTESDLGFSHKLTGSGKGLGPFISGKTPWAVQELLSHVRMRLQSGLNASFKGKTNVTPDYWADGSVSSDLDLELVPQSGLDLSGEVRFDEFSLGGSQGITVNRLNGKLPISKKIQIVAQGSKSEPSSPPASKEEDVSKLSFFSDLRRYSTRQKSVTLDDLSVGNLDVKNLVFDLFFLQNELGMDHYEAEFLDGGITGTFYFHSENNVQTLKFSSEFAGIDLQKLLLGKKLTEKEDTEVNGNAVIDFSLAPKNKGDTLDIDNVNVSIYITKIGNKALDRLLLFLDPEESNPSIVSARSALKLANPKQVTISIKNGNLNLSVRLKYSVVVAKGELTLPVLQRLPLNSLKNFNQIQEPLKSLEEIRKTLAPIGTSAILLSPDGKISIRY